MWYHKELGLIHQGQSFTLRNQQYPSNWLELATAEEQSSLGFLSVQVQSKPDEQFYQVSENLSVVDGVAVVYYTTSPRPVNDVINEDGSVTTGLKSQMISSIKEIARSILAPSDWKVIRAAEGMASMDVATLAYRSSIRDASNAHEAAILACTTVEELASLHIVWPEFIDTTSTTA
jgi:hypothetical protein